MPSGGLGGLAVAARAADGQVATGLNVYPPASRVGLARAAAERRPSQLFWCCAAEGLAVNRDARDARQSPTVPYPVGRRTDAHHAPR
jgi:hypothetical protein